MKVEDKKKGKSKEDSIKSILLFLGEGAGMPEKVEEEEEEEKEEAMLPKGADLLSMLQNL
jgi:hypothetical protein